MRGEGQAVGKESLCGKQDSTRRRVQEAALRSGAGSGLEAEACFSEMDPRVPNPPSPHSSHTQGDGCPEQRRALVCVPTSLCQENCCSHLPYQAFLEGRALFSFWVSYSDLSLSDLRGQTPRSQWKRVPSGLSSPPSPG